MLFDVKNPPQIGNVNEAVTWALGLKGSVYFRGESDVSWKLLPAIARLETIAHAGQPVPVHKNHEQEKLLLHRFRRHSYEQRGRILTEWETLFLARHHSLPTRLLDWSSNPFVALYFASLHEGNTDKDGRIWWFSRKYKQMYVDVFDETTKPLDYKGVQVVFPFYPSVRITAQSGIFTIHSPEYWNDLKNLKKDDAKDHGDVKIDIEEGGCCIIPAMAKPTILQQLERFGINHRTLFPDLDGLAKGLMQNERFRTAAEYP